MANSSVVETVGKNLSVRAMAELELRKRTGGTGGGYALFKSTYRSDPVAFAHDCFEWADGTGPTFYQDEIMGALPGERRVSVRGPHGLGKTTLASWMILWFALTRDGEDWKIPTTASAWRQLTKFLWPEVRKWIRRVKWEKIGRRPIKEKVEFLNLSLKLATGEAFALVSDNAALIEGAHAASLLYVFDEAKSIPEPTWDAAEGAFSTGDAYWLAISTPGEPVGRFYDIQTRKPGYHDWWTKAVTLEETIKAGRVSREWSADRAIQWGKDTAVYQNRVEGQFASSEEDGVIPLSWIEAANERWNILNETGKWGPFIGVGVDVARSGEDQTVLALRHGMAIRELRKYSKSDTMETTGLVSGVLRANGGKAVVDVIGYGAGVVDRLREQNLPVEAFNASERSEDADRTGELGFVDQRAAAWWNLRELLDPTNSPTLALPPDDSLTGDLSSPHWRVMSGGKIRVESKDDIRKRIKRSTDDGDAVVQIMTIRENAGESAVIAPEDPLIAMDSGAWQ